MCACRQSSRRRYLKALNSSKVCRRKRQRLIESHGEELEASSLFHKEVKTSQGMCGVKCLHLSSWCLGWLPHTFRSTCLLLERALVRCYRLAEGKLSVSKILERLGAKSCCGAWRAEGRAEPALQEGDLGGFPGSEMGKLGAGFNLSGSPNKCKSQPSVQAWEGVALLILGGIGSREGWLLPDFHHRCSAW